ncbi:RNA ligase-domain-containing protein [Diaporthe sp. PMI_573]|nr:RNA ligase-domain-containing protein [Diaporthaceae sp. PMI_573]
MEKDVELINATLLVMYRDRNWAEVLGVKKWEERPVQPEQPEHRRLGPYPTEVFKRTDLRRVEECPNLFKKDKYNKFVYQESVKMDGTAMVVYFVKKSCPYFSLLNPLPENVGPNTVLEGAQGARFGVCSNKVDKNELEVGGSAGYRYWETALRHDLPAKLSQLGRNIAIQGELCGEPIQGNREGLPEGEQEFFVYAMFHIDRQDFINPREVEAMAKKLGLKHVPVLGYNTLTKIASSHKDLQKRAAQSKGEGLVYKCIDDGRRFKVISNTYLLEHGL